MLSSNEIAIITKSVINNQAAAKEVLQNFRFFVTNLSSISTQKKGGEMGNICYRKLTSQMTL